MDIIKKRSYPQFQPKTHLIFFLILFFCSIVMTNLRLSEEVFWIGFQMENTLKQFDIPSLSLSSFAIWFIKNRMAAWLLLCLIGYFYQSNVLYLIATGWFGFSSGFFMTTLIQHFGMVSFPLLFGFFLPHLPFYLFGYMQLIKNKIHRESVYIPKCLLLSCLYAGGSFCEYYLNPWILQKIYHLTTLVP